VITVNKLPQNRQKLLILFSFLLNFMLPSNAITTINVKIVNDTNFSVAPFSFCMTTKSPISRVMANKYYGSFGSTSPFSKQRLIFHSNMVLGIFADLDDYDHNKIIVYKNSHTLILNKDYHVEKIINEGNIYTEGENKTIHRSFSITIHISMSKQHRDLEIDDLGIEPLKLHLNSSMYNSEWHDHSDQPGEANQ
jgi:hypothetical protein